jgi:hypothetical protein
VRKLLLLGGCLIGAALVLSACGGGEGDEDKIASAIETLATSTDPADCVALSTLAFMEQTESEEGKAAEKACEEDAEEPSGDPDSVTVSEVEVDGAAATANVAFVGGNLDGQTLTIGLVEEDGDWKLDQLESFAEFDKAKLVAAFDEGLTESGELEEALASCMVEELEASSNEELEELVLSGSPEGFIALAESCE